MRRPCLAAADEAATAPEVSLWDPHGDVVATSEITLVDEYYDEARTALAASEAPEARLNLAYIDAMRAVFQVLLTLHVERTERG